MVGDGVGTFYGATVHGGDRRRWCDLQVYALDLADRANSAAAGQEVA